MTRVAPPRLQEHARGGAEVLLLVGGGALLVASGLAVGAGAVSGAEASVFRVINGTTVLPFVVVWPIMQFGNFLVVPVATIVAAALRRWWLALELLVAGLATYELAKVVKRIVVRGRPHAFLSDTVIRGAEAHGLGFVSGHAATLSALAGVAWPCLGRAGRITVASLIVFVSLARVYVGAHLPLDVLGGVGLGLAVAGAVRLVMGRAR